MNALSKKKITLTTNLYNTFFLRKTDPVPQIICTSITRAKLQSALQQTQKNELPWQEARQGQIYHQASEHLSSSSIY